MRSGGEDHVYKGRGRSRDLTRTVKCSFCDRRFKTREDAARHEGMRHKKLLRKLPRTASPPPENPSKDPRP